MMTTISMETMRVNDADLVAQSLAGNRDAFGQIVARYQSLVCSLAYSATGNLARSEELAQETFLAAWKQLARLKEPDKLRPWLCRIARNLTCDAIGQDGREPSHRAESLEEIAESQSLEPLPVDHVISNEEQTILWRSIGRIPEMYREPLVLFYRENQSVEAVAQNLELSEVVVKQRLSRGRKMLHDEVLTFVEGALQRTNPGKAFTLAVLAILPAVSFSAKAATASMAVKGMAGGAKTAGVMGWLGMLLGPLIVFVPNFIAYRITLAGAYSDEERAGVKSLWGKLGIISLAIFLPIAGFILWFTRHEADRSDLGGLFACILVVIFVPTILLLMRSSKTKTRAHLSRILDKYHAGVLPKPGFEYRSRLSFLGLPLIHIRMDDRFSVLRKPVRAWIAVGQSAVGGLFAYGSRAIAPVSVGAQAVGILSFGALSLGVVAIGGISVGIWTLFGALVIGWQAFGGCFALGWNAAAGQFAIAHDYAVGQFASAAQANNPAASGFIQPDFFYHFSCSLVHHWQWLTLFWAIPFLVLWRVYRRRAKPGLDSSVAVRLLIPLLATTVFLSAGCNKSGELGTPSTFTKPSGPVELKQHWHTGERILKSFDMQMTSEIAVPGRPNPIKQDMSFRLEWAIHLLKKTLMAVTRVKWSCASSG